MGRKTRPLVGLEHIVRPAVLSRHGEVRGDDVLGIVDVSELKLRPGAGACASDVAGTVHLANSFRIRVAHRRESLMGVAQIVLVRKRDGAGLGDARSGILIQPVAGLDVVLRRGRGGAAPVFGSARGRAQAIKQIVGRAVFLDDHNNVLKACDLCRSHYRGQAEETQELRGSYHNNCLLLETRLARYSFVKLENRNDWQLRRGRGAALFSIFKELKLGLECITLGFRVYPHAYAWRLGGGKGSDGS